MNTLVTLLRVGGLLAVVLVLGGCACGYHGHYDCYDCYDSPEVVIIDVSEIPDCFPDPAEDPIIVQIPPPRRQPIDRTPVKSTPPPRTKEPREPRTSDKPAVVRGGARTDRSPRTR